MPDDLRDVKVPEGRDISQVILIQHLADHGHYVERGYCTNGRGCVETKFPLHNTKQEADAVKKHLKKEP